MSLIKSLIKNVAITGLCVLTSTAYTQNLQEWTQQKKTQIKYLVNQIAAFEVYTSYARKGIAIANDDLNAIKNIKKGDLSLHKGYFSSLTNINPSVKRYWKVADIISKEAQLFSNCIKQMHLLKQNTSNTAGEITYCIKIFQVLLNDCSDYADQLSALITAGALSLKDNERIQRIDALHSDIMDKYSFEQHFSNQITVLSVQRFKEANDIKTGRLIFNIN